VAGGVGTIPVFGSLAEKVFALCVVPPRARKLETFFADVAEALNRHSVAIERLSEEPRFQDAAVQAATVAGRTSDLDKRAMLRNALLNVARQTEDEPHEDVFLGLIDILSPTHLRVLDYLDSPTTSRHGGPGAGRVVVESVASGMNLDIGIATAVVTDLRARGLLKDEPRGVRLPHDPTERQTTDLGHRFLAFVRECSPSERPASR
jgi:hypothetical protein